MNRPRAFVRTAGLILFLSATGAAAAEDPLTGPTPLVGGSSGCPTPGLVWQRLVSLVPSQVLIDRLERPGGPVPPVQIVDLGPGFRVTAGARVREYAEAARDCAKRAQFAAVFVAVAAGADTAPADTARPAATESIRAAPAWTVAPPPEARARLDLGATAGAALGGDTTVAPGLALRIAFGRGRLVPVAAVTVLAPAGGDVGGVGIRQWQAMADVDVRSPVRAAGRSRLYVELGAAVELFTARPTTLAVARTQVSYAVGPRAGAGWRLATAGSLSPFFLIQGAWFPRPPELFALPAGDLGRVAAWNLGATVGASWGIL